MAMIVVDAERCKGCELCISFCPKGLIRAAKKMNSRGFHAAELRHKRKCSGCAQCAMMCPDLAITVYR
jgi:2-oxoglutarate ferredoxin oxidoreductase subunit delta